MSDVPISSAASEMVRSAANELNAPIIAVDIFQATIISPSWITYANALLLDGSNCSITAPSIWADFDAGMTAAKAIIDSVDFDSPPIPWGNPVNFPPNCDPSEQVTGSRILVYQSIGGTDGIPGPVTPDPGHAYKIIDPAWYRQEDQPSGNLHAWDQRGGLIHNTCGGPNAVVACNSNGLPCITFPICGVICPTWMEPSVTKIRIKTPGCCLEGWHTNFSGGANVVTSCSHDTTNRIFNYPSLVDPSNGHTASSGQYVNAAWIWDTNPDSACSGCPPI